MINIEYDRDKALNYAKAWAYGRNPSYYNFDNIGGDCTNFASQVIYAGCGVMNYAQYGWYYNSLNDRAPAWTGVEFLHDFLVNNKNEGPYAEEVDKKDVEVGDIVQLSFIRGTFGHSPVITRTGRELLVAAHTFDAYNRPLESYDYYDVRFIHIIGARK